MVEIQKKPVSPVCPHCEREVDHLVEVDRGWFAVNRVFCCPHCHKILGMTSS